MADTPFEKLFPAMPRHDREWEARKERLIALTAAQRVAAMRAGKLSYRELCHWSAVRPEEVPVVGTGQGGPGEFEWIAMFEPGIAEHDQATSRDALEMRARAEPRQRSPTDRIDGSP